MPYIKFSFAILGVAFAILAMSWANALTVATRPYPAIAVELSRSAFPIMSADFPVAAENRTFETASRE